MPKVGMGPIRRQQLMDATLFSVGSVGLPDTTVALISKQAGVSSGIISHYFGGKDELLEATMRQLLKRLQTGISLRLSSAQTARESLYAIIDGNFSVDQTDTSATRAWLSFWAHALHHPDLRRLQKVNQFRLQSNLRFWLKQLTTQQEAFRIAESLAAVIDGLWLRGAFLEHGIDSDHCQQLARKCLDDALLSAPSLQDTL